MLYQFTEAAKPLVCASLSKEVAIAKAEKCTSIINQK